MSAVRTDCDLREDQVSDDELEELFCMVDADGSSSIDADEFYAFLTASSEPEMTYDAFKRSMFELTDVWCEEISEAAYCSFLATVFETIACPSGNRMRNVDAIDDVMSPNGQPQIRLRDLDDVQQLVDKTGKFREQVRDQLRRRGLSKHSLPIGEDRQQMPVAEPAPTDAERPRNSAETQQQHSTDDKDIATAGEESKDGGDNQKQTITPANSQRDRGRIGRTTVGAGREVGREKEPGRVLGDTDVQGSSVDERSTGSALGHMLPQERLSPSSATGRSGI
eukprot:SAG31_NODE_6133_length_2156_cov_1.166262_1_plen_279_part_10